MKYETEFDVYSFPFWGGGKVWAEKFFEESKADALAESIEEFFRYLDEVPTGTAINDYVWFNDALHELLDEYKEECSERMA